MQATKAKRSNRICTAGEHVQIVESECGGDTRIQLRTSACGTVKVLIPPKMETPWVAMRMGARHEDRQIMKSLRTCLVESGCDLFE